MGEGGREGASQQAQEERTTAQEERTTRLCDCRMRPANTSLLGNHLTRYKAREQESQRFPGGSRDGVWQQMVATFDVIILSGCCAVLRFMRSLAWADEGGCTATPHQLGKTHRRKGPQRSGSQWSVPRVDSSEPGLAPPPVVIVTAAGGGTGLEAVVHRASITITLHTGTAPFTSADPHTPTASTGR